MLHEVNKDWLYGRIDDREGIFPANFIDILVPISEDDKKVVVLYQYNAQFSGDLSLMPGQIVHVLYRVSENWLYGECNGYKGQFPQNFVNRIPLGI